MTTSFGDVRALVHHPSERNWGHLIAALRAWPDPQELRQVVLPYCDQALATWPDTWRHAPASWTNQALAARDQVHPGIALARSIAFGPRQGRSPSWLKLWEDYDLTQITSLELDGDGEKPKLPKRDLEKLFERLDEANLKALKLRDIKLKLPQWEAVLSSKTLARIESLSLDRCRMQSLSMYGAENSDNMTLKMWKHHEMSGLRHLCLRDNRLRQQDIAVLAGLDIAQGLETLRFGATPNDPSRGDRHIWSNRAELHGIRTLCDPNLFPALEALELSYNQLAKDSLQPLFVANMTSLKRLDLHLNHMSSADGQALARAPFLQRLEALDVSGTTIGMRATIMLCEELAGSAIQALHLNRVKMKRAGAEALMRARGLDALRHLGFADNELYDDTLAIFSDSAHTQLAHLNLIRNTINDESFADFLRAPFLGTLRTLMIPDLTDAQVIELLEHPELQQLERLVVYSRRTARDNRLRAHPLGHKLEFLRSELYHYLDYTPLLITMPGLHDATPR